MRGFLIALLISISLVPAILAAQAQGVLQPVDLRCEYRANPLGVDATAPRLSWKSEPTAPATRGLGQSAYQILVARSAALLMSNQGDLWDTGKVDGDTSIQVPYAGKPLVSGQEVWWKVCVWDDKPSARGRGRVP